MASLAIVSACLVPVFTGKDLARPLPASVPQGSRETLVCRAQEKVKAPWTYQTPQTATIRCLGEDYNSRGRLEEG